MNKKEEGKPGCVLRFLMGAFQNQYRKIFGLGGNRLVVRDRGGHLALFPCRPC